MLDTMAVEEKSLSNIEWPFLILHGEPDELTSVKGSKLMYEKAKSKDKQLKVNMVPSNSKLVRYRQYLMIIKGKVLVCSP